MPPSVYAALRSWKYWPHARAEDPARYPLRYAAIVFLQCAVVIGAHLPRFRQQLLLPPDLRFRRKTISLIPVRERQRDPQGNDRRIHAVRASGNSVRLYPARRFISGRAETSCKRTFAFACSTAARATLISALLRTT